MGKKVYNTSNLIKDNIPVRNLVRNNELTEKTLHDNVLYRKEWRCQDGCKAARGNVITGTIYGN